jgi:hypothetical protein
MMLDDVATRTNFFEFGLGYLIPSFENFDDDMGQIGFVYNSKREKLYQYLNYYDSNIVYLQKWNTSWLFYNDAEQIKQTNFLEYSVNELKVLHNTHNSKYDLLFNKLLKLHSHSLFELENIDRIETNIPEESESLAVEISEPVNTVEELIDGMVTLTPIFFTNERDYIMEEPRKKRINNKLKAAKEARIEYEEAVLQKADQNTQRTTRLLSRNANKEIREEINDISHHTATDILELYKEQDKPIVFAEDPEENMVDFSLILGQLEAKSMFLKGDGLNNLRALTMDAINRGKINRFRLPPIEANRAAGGGGNKKGGL